MTGISNRLSRFRLIEKSPPSDYANDLRAGGVPEELILQLYTVHADCYRQIAAVELSINYSVLSRYDVRTASPEQFSSLGAWRAFLGRLHTLEQELGVPTLKAEELGRRLDEWISKNK